MTTRAPTRPYTPSTDDTERMTRSGSGTGSSPRRNGVSTSRSPPNQSLIRAASYVVPTARMSEPEPGGLVRQPLVAEAVAVALADRDEPRELLGHVLVVRPPARGVDVERERHGRTWNLSRGCGVSEV